MASRCFLLNGMTARQIMLIAGRNLLVEKSVTFEDVRVNDPEFEGERTAARASDRIMFRETDRGLRYYVKQGEARVISDRPTQSAKAMAMGVTIDPSYAFPLPIFGINYLDFDFGGPDSQLAHALCRGAGRREHPAAQARVDAVRRERRLLRHRRAVERSASTARAASAPPSAC